MGIAHWELIPCMPGNRNTDCAKALRVVANSAGDSVDMCADVRCPGDTVQHQYPVPAAGYITRSHSVP